MGNEVSGKLIRKGAMEGASILYSNGSSVCAGVPVGKFNIGVCEDEIGARKFNIICGHTPTFFSREDKKMFWGIK